MKKCALLAFMVAFWLQPLLASDDSAKQEAIKKIDLAVARTNIFELPSFQMKANVQIEKQGKHVDGSYQLLWNGPEQWREEIRFPDYKEVQVGGKGTIWIQRSTDFYPLRIFELHSALGFGTSPPTGPLVQSSFTEKDKLQKIRERKAHGERQICVEYESTLKRQEICVNESTNTLAREPSYVDKDVQPVGGGKVYPRSLGFVENGDTVAEVNITEIVTPVEFPPDSFAPPVGTLPRPGAVNPTSPRLIKKVSPRYPESAKQRHVEGTVALNAWIASDGVPRIGQVVGHASPDLERSSMDAVKEWRYEPAICNGKPVEVEAVLTVIYSLRSAGW